MNILDWIIIVVLCFFLIKSIVRGATREIFSLLALIVASLVSCRYYTVLVLFLRPHIQTSINPEWAQNVVAFVLIFVVIYILVNLTGWLLSKLFKSIHLGFLDRTAGALIGAIKAYIVVCCVIVLLILFPQSKKLLENSVLSVYSYPFVKILSKALPEPLNVILEDKANRMKKN